MRSGNVISSRENYETVRRVDVEGRENALMEYEVRITNDLAGTVRP